MAYWTFIKPAHAEGFREQVRLPFQLRDDLGGERVRRQHARRVAAVDAGLLDVLHHADDDAAARHRVTS